MNINDYQNKAARTCAKIDGGIMDDIHMILGIQTESAEIADAYKKYIAYKNPLDLVNVKEEIGDTIWYIANMCNMHGWDLRDILDTNIAKLEARYPEKFTEEQAINRDLVSERQVLEGTSITQHINFAIDNQSIT